MSNLRRPLVVGVLALAVVASGAVPAMAAVPSAGSTDVVRKDTSAPPAPALDDGGPIVEGEVLVTWRKGLNAASRQWLRDRYSLDLQRRLNSTGVEQVSLGQDEPVDLAVARLAVDDRVIAVQPNYRYSRQTGDTYYDELWGLNNTGQALPTTTVKGISNVDLDAPQAWALTKGSPSVVVAVIDTGVQIAHPDLAPNVWTNPVEIPSNGVDDDNDGYVDDVNGWDFYNNNASVYDGENCGGFNNDDHGTHVAGTIAGAENDLGIVGVAPGVRIMPLKIIGCDGGSTADVISALEYASDHGAKIANMSLGGPLYDGALKSAIDASGLLVVAAAGNGDFGAYSPAYGLPYACFSTGGDPVSQCPMYPAAFSSSNLLSVAAITNRGQLANFSAYGATGPNGSSSTGVDLGAPGDDVISSVPIGYGAGSTYGVGFLSGTSMAAPHVSGVAALALSRDASLSTSQLKQRVLDRGRAMSKLTNGVTNSGRMASAGGAVGVTSLAASFSASPGTYGYGTLAKGTLTAGSGLSGRALELLRYVPSSNSWVSQCTATTTSSGTASCFVKPTRATTYEWRFAGGTGLTQSWSGQKRFTVKAKVGISVTDATPKRRQTVKFTAYVYPNRAYKQVTLQRLSGSTWKTVRTANLWSTGKRTFAVTPTQAGTTKWRMRYGGDSDYLANSSRVLSLKTS